MPVRGLHWHCSAPLLDFGALLLPSNGIWATTLYVSIDMMLANGGSSALFAAITSLSAESKHISSALLRLLGIVIVGPLLVGIGFDAPGGTDTGIPVVAFKTQTRLLPSPTQSCFTPLLSSVSTPSGPETSLLPVHTWVPEHGDAALHKMPVLT